MNVCKKCGREYSPTEEFVEDYELQMSVEFFTEMNSLDSLCPDCIYELSDKISELVRVFKSGERDGIS